MNSYRTIVFAGLFASWLLFSPALAQAAAASPDGTSVPPASSIVDSRGNVWTLTANGQIARNGRIDRITNSVLLLVYSGGAVYQKTSWIGNDGQNLWWRWSRIEDGQSPRRCSGTSSSGSSGSTILDRRLAGRPSAWL